MALDEKGMMLSVGNGTGPPTRVFVKMEQFFLRSSLVGVREMWSVYLTLRF